MKRTLCIALGLLLLQFTPAFGQPRLPSPSSIPRGATALPQRLDPNTGLPVQPPALTRFSLDFDGGTPTELVKAIEKAMGKPLNAIIRDEDKDVRLPELKMNDVNVQELFQALEQASQKQMTLISGTYSPGMNSYSQFVSYYSFRTAGEVSDNSIWYFHVEKPTLPPVVPTEKTEKYTQFYSLDPYLQRGFTVDDITTAIQTGWKMAGVAPTPQMNYHKETKLLIVNGNPKDLNTVRQVLDALPSSNATRTAIQELRSEMDQLQQQIKQNQSRVERLIKELSAKPAASSEEKSGKSN